MLHDYYLRNLDYGELLSLTKNGYPVSFRQSWPFNRVQIVFVNDKVQDSNALLIFLMNCMNLWSLQVTNSSLYQEFYDRLPAAEL